MEYLPCVIYWNSSCSLKKKPKYLLSNVVLCVISIDLIKLNIEFFLDVLTALEEAVHPGFAFIFL